MPRPITVLTALLLLAAGAPATTAQGVDPITGVLRAIFHSDGRVALPEGYRQWVHIGTRYNPGGISILDGLPLKTPEIMNAYVEPGAMKRFSQTEVWPDGTQIVKEMSATQVGDGCDPTTHICIRDIGRGIFETTFMGLGMMVKDEKRFPEAPGHWGYFSFGHQPLPYDSTSLLRPTTQCQGCHVALASGSDYVIARAHIGLTSELR